MTEFLDRFWRFVSQPPKNIFVVEVKAMGNDAQFLLTALHHKKSTLEVEDFWIFSSLEELKSRLKKQGCVLWVYNTLELLIHVSEKEKEASLNSAFPNLNRTDFFLQKNRNFITLCRKKNIQNLQALLEEHALPCSCIFLGLEPLIAHLEMFESPLNLPNFTVEHLKGNLKFITLKEEPSNPKTISIMEAYEISNETLIGLCAAICFLQLHKTAVVLEPQATVEYKNTFDGLKKKWINRSENDLLQKRILKYVLPVFFSILLIHYGFQFWIQNQLNALEEENQLTRMAQQKLSHQQKNIDEKVNRLNKYASFTESNVSFYLDSLLVNLPKSLLLKSFVYQPLLGRISSESEIELSAHVVEIEGELLQKNEFDEWIDRLRQLAWVEEVKIVQYGTLQGKKMNFEIEILLENAS